MKNSSDDENINDNCTDDCHSALLLYLKEGGAELPLLAIKPYSSEHKSTSDIETGTQRGVFTVSRKVEDIDNVDEDVDRVAKAGTVILKIPLGLLITVSIAREESEVGRLMYIQEQRIFETDGEIEDDWTEEIDLDDECRRCEEGTEEIIPEFKNENESENGDEDSELSGDELDDDDICDVLGLDMSAPMHCYLAAFILEDRLSPSSRFLPYYDSLPLVLPHIPLFWSDDDLHHLYGSFLYIQVLNRRNTIKHDYEETCHIYPQFANIATLNDYNWARMIVTSRNFGLDIITNKDNEDVDRKFMDLDGMTIDKIDTDFMNINSLDSSDTDSPLPSSSNLPPPPSPLLSPPSPVSLPLLPPFLSSPSSVVLEAPTKTLTRSMNSTVPSELPVVPLHTLPSLMTTLVPFGDMLNHYRPRQTMWTFDHSLQAFTVTAVVDLKAGCEIQDSYGKKCNSRFLLNYGFVVHENKEANGRCYNEVRLFFKLDETDAGYRVKKMLYGGSFDMDEHSNGTRNSDDNSKDKNSNSDENNMNCACKYNDSHNDSHDNSSINNEDDVKKSLRGRVKGRGARLSMQHDDLTSKESLSLARFVCAQGRELLRLPLLLSPSSSSSSVGNDYNLQIKPIEPLSISSEVAVLRLIKNMLTDQLQRYTSFKEVEREGKEAENKGESSNRQNAYILIEGEKEVCNHWIALCSQCIPLLLKVPSNSHGSHNSCSDIHSECEGDDDENGRDDSNRVVNLDSSSNRDEFCRYIEYLRTHYSITDSPNNPNNDNLMTSDNNGIGHMNTNDNSNLLNCINIDSNNSKSNNKMQGHIPTNKTGDADSNISLLGLNRYVTLVIIPLLERHEAEKNKS